MKNFYDIDKTKIDQQLAGDLETTINEIIVKRDVCNVAIAGGRSIASVLDLITQKNINWSKVHVFAVDDRCLPIDDEKSNSYLIKHHLADKVAVNFHPFPYNPNLENKGTVEYTKELNEYGGKFDVLLLSAGEDGHTAGLFPGSRGLASDSMGYIFFNDSPKPPAERVSATIGTLLKSESAFLMFIGEAKRDAYERFLDTKVPLSECPSKLVQQLPEANIYTDIVVG